MKVRNIEDLQIETEVDNNDGSVTKRYYDIDSEEAKKLIKEHKIKPHEPTDDKPDAISEARKVLNDTHDEVVRAFDTGQPVPDDINAARVAAWSVIDAAKKSTA